MNNCPRKIRLFGSMPPTGSLPNKSSSSEYIELSSNSANLKKIICVPGIEVPLQLLAIEEIINCNDANTCKSKFNSPSHKDMECYVEYENFAHLYITEENPKAFIKHYVIIFVEAKNIGNYNGLINMLRNTVKELKVADKRPYFFIYYYGNRPAINLSISDIKNLITKQLRIEFKNYTSKESFCRVHTAEYNATNFTINSSNPYQFNYS